MHARRVTLGLCFCLQIVRSQKKMTHALEDFQGYLALTAAASDTTSVGALAVHLQLVLLPIVKPSDGTLETEVQRSLVRETLRERTMQSNQLSLELSLQQAFHLLSELEDLEAKFVSEER